VVVTDTLDWRLHSFDLMSEWSAERAPETLRSHAFMLADAYKPEELRKDNWDALRDAPPWCAHMPASATLSARASSGCVPDTTAPPARAARAVDAWGMGCLVQEIFAGHKLARTEELRELARVPQVSARGGSGNDAPKPQG
jgi:SCY1-like protein 1